MGFFGTIGSMVGGGFKGSEGVGPQQRFTQADFSNYKAGGDYGAAPTYDHEANKKSGWAGMVGNLDRTVSGMTPGGMENYNRRQYLQQQMDLKDPQMNSLWEGRDDWQKNPGMVDEMWGDVNKFYGNEKAGGGAAPGVPPGPGGVAKTAAAAGKKMIGAPQRQGMGTNIGAMAQTSRASSYEG